MKSNEDLNTLSNVRMRDNIESWGPCPEMSKAWPLLPDNDSDDSYRAFRKEFRPLLPTLDQDGMENTC